MLRSAAKRFAAGATVMLGSATLAFTALQLVPGDPVAVLLGPTTSASPQVRAQIRTEYGFDRPVPVRFAHYLGDLVRGDLGTSYQLQQPVTKLINDQLWPTVQLVAAAVALAVVIAVVSAMTTAGRRPSLRAAATVWELVALSTPPFWLGIMLLTVFSFRLRIFPVAGAQSVSSLVLPAVTLALSVAGVLAQVLREGLEAALAQPFVVTARARGLSRTAVRVRHAFRHAAAPVLTLTGWLTGTLLGGAVLIETVFARPGIGSLTLQAVTSRDLPVVMGVVLLSAFAVVLIFTVVDLLHLAIDPRLRTAAAAI
ncbi:ABC transporter permease [Frankia sp. Cppng1_Ct_nod]|uniref:ABC transporter permease n=1 Tax=Frankia sp. Cppng1_Ct_nod TaxID=2897162 RepID=UPI0024E05296|nr:ABC transporter permease [Frankia sp. Cppng1_Ct_nod]